MAGPVFASQATYIEGRQRPYCFFFFLMRVFEVRGRDESTCTGHMAALIRQPGHEADNVSVSEWLAVCLCVSSSSRLFSHMLSLCVCVCSTRMAEHFVVMPANRVRHFFSSSTLSFL